jgi:protein SCO1/2
LEKDAALRGRVRLLSVTIDPAYDTPKVLRSYGGGYTEKYGAETFERWEFATGDPEEVKKLAQFFGLEYFAEKEQIVHSLRTAVIDPSGRVHKIYRGNEWKPEQVLADMRKAVNGEP